MKGRVIQKLTEDGTPLPAALKAAELASSSNYYRSAVTRKPRAFDRELVVGFRVDEQCENKALFQEETNSPEGRGGGAERRNIECETTVC